MTTAENVLEELGFTQTEAIIYLTLVKRGLSSAYRVSKDSNLYKANTYMAIESLVQKSFVTKIEVNGKQVYKAIAPEELLKNLERQKERVQAILPLIERHFNEELEEVSVFVGIDSLFNIFYSLLQKKKPIFVYDIPKYIPELVIRHIGKFHAARIVKKVKMFHIYDYDATDRIAYLKKLPYTYAKRGQQERLSVASTLVCGDTILIINWKKGIKIVKIVDIEIAQAHQKQFDVLWKYK